MSGCVLSEEYMKASSLLAEISALCLLFLICCIKVPWESPVQTMRLSWVVRSSCPGLCQRNFFIRNEAFQPKAFQMCRFYYNWRFKWIVTWIFWLQMCHHVIYKIQESLLLKLTSYISHTQCEHLWSWSTVVPVHVCAFHVRLHSVIWSPEMEHPRCAALIHPKWRIPLHLLVTISLPVHFTQKHMILPQMNTACGEDDKATQLECYVCVRVRARVCVCVCSFSQMSGLLHVIKKDLTVQLIHVHQNECCISM